MANRIPRPKRPKPCAIKNHISLHSCSREDVQSVLSSCGDEFVPEHIEPELPGAGIDVSLHLENDSAWDPHVVQI